MVDMILINNENVKEKLRFPVYPGDTLITNGTVTVNNVSFADCVETAIRQFLAMLLCKRNEKGERFIDLNILPETSKLRAALQGAPDAIKKEGVVVADYLMNDGSKEVRNWWATCVSNLEGINYGRETVELVPGYKNALKVICELLKGDNPSGALAEIIGYVENNYTNKVKECFEQLLRLQPGVKLDIKSPFTSSNNEYLGDISFYMEDSKEVNNVNLYFSSSHGQVFNRTSRTLSNVSPDAVADIMKQPWLQQLYINPNIPIYGSVTPSYYSKVSSPFPLLEYAAVLRKDISLEKRFATYREITGSGNLIPGIVRQLFIMWELNRSYEWLFSDNLRRSREEVWKNNVRTIGSVIFAPIFQQGLMSYIDIDVSIKMLLIYAKLSKKNAQNVEKMAKNGNSLMGACFLRFLFGQTEKADNIFEKRILKETNDKKFKQSKTDLFISLQYINHYFLSGRYEASLIAENTGSTINPIDANVLRRIFPSVERMRGNDIEKWRLFFFSM
jgi:hypothetical protein